MNVKKVSITLLCITATALLVVLAFRVRIGATADSIAVLKTTGMTCSSCSGKISRALETLPGVAVTEVDVAGGWVVVGYDTKRIQPEKLEAKVTAAGFSSRVQTVLTPEQYKQITGRDLGKKALSGGCGGCGNGGGCGGNKPS